MQQAHKALQARKVRKAQPVRQVKRDPLGLGVLLGGLGLAALLAFLALTGRLELPVTSELPEQQDRMERQDYLELRVVLVPPDRKVRRGWYAQPDSVSRPLTYINGTPKPPSPFTGA